jgi:hypothetical protein
VGQDHHRKGVVTFFQFIDAIGKVQYLPSGTSFRCDFDPKRLAIVKAYRAANVSDRFFVGYPSTVTARSGESLGLDTYWGENSNADI